MFRRHLAGERLQQRDDGEASPRMPIPGVANAVFPLSQGGEFWTMVKVNRTLIAESKSERMNRRTGIHRSAVFRALLAHERSRADRDGSSFSLLVLDVSALNGNGDGVQLITKAVQGQARSIDEAGWLDARRIGILLPATGNEGGKKFAARLFNSLAAVASRIPWVVYTYPDNWIRTGEVEENQESLTPPRSVQTLFSTSMPVWKRLIDILGSSVLIVVLSPLFLLHAIYIKLVSPGKVLFKQQRVGYGGKQFTFLKFRTMSQDSDCRQHKEYLKELIRNAEPMAKLDGSNDPRIIPGGKVLRKACLDELPQLVNVLKGEMSLVGPRPCIPYEATEYLRWHTHRFDIVPGMTGLWQVSGKNKLTFEQMIRLDIEYANHLSLFQDLKILLLTGPAIIGMVLEAVVDRLRAKRAHDA